jgi:hypothetical protein
MKKSIVSSFLAAGLAVMASGSAKAGDVDLTAPGSSATINGAVYQQEIFQPAGTGFIRSFVRLQSPGHSTEEKGYNTDGRKTLFDENNSPQFTRSLLLSDLVSLNGNYTFLLDVNEPNGKKDDGLLNLTELKVYLGATGDELEANPDDLGTKIFDQGDNVALLKDLGNGSGKSDYTVSIPVTDFNVGGGNFVYLYSHFTNAQGGFEEWAAHTGTTPPPPPHGIPLPAAFPAGLAMIGLLGAASVAQRIRKSIA